MDQTFLVTVADTKSSVYTEMVKQLCLRCNWRLTKNTERFKCDLYLGERNNLPYSKLAVHLSQKPVLINYYKGSDVICRKSEFVRVIRSAKLEVEDWLPKSFVVSPKHSKIDDRESLGHFMSSESTRPFIVKATGASKGDGILISTDYEKILDFVDKSAVSHVVQEYIDRPLLLSNGHRKFDVRCWVLLDHNFDVYFYDYGVLRTCSDPYDPNDFSKTTAHLTNHYLQENFSDNYEKYEESNELFFDDFRSILSEKQIKYEDVISTFKSIASICISAIRERCKVDASSLMQHFQIFGFDYMLDENGKVFLLEINGAPACAERLKTQFVSDLISQQILSFFHDTSFNVTGTNFHRIHTES